MFEDYKGLSTHLHGKEGKFFLFWVYFSHMTHCNMRSCIFHKNASISLIIFFFKYTTMQALETNRMNNISVNSAIESIFHAFDVITIWQKNIEAALWAVRRLKQAGREYFKDIERHLLCWHSRVLIVYGKLENIFDHDFSRFVHFRSCWT